MEVIQVAQQLNKTTKRLSKSTKEVFKMAKERAETEREYRQALMQEIVKLRNEGYPATLIADVARGRTADLKFKRDLSMEMHRSALASIERSEEHTSELQSRGHLVCRLHLEKKKSMCSCRLK